MAIENTETGVSDPRVEGVLAAFDVIRPALQSDGGDIVFNYIDDQNQVHVTLTGACGTCAISTLTLKAGVERIVLDRVPGVTGVVNDGDANTQEANCAH